MSRPHNILPAVTDNASNMTISVKEVELTPHVGCLTHRDNLATTQDLEVTTINWLLVRVRRIVAFFHRSKTATAVLVEKQQLLQLPVNKLIRDVATKWNSAYKMLEQFLEQQLAVNSVMVYIGKTEKDLPYLSNDDTHNAWMLVVVLKPLKNSLHCCVTRKNPQYP